jgi:predicted O-linked N-acetylglucosamine transferase (SPINDLY family)
VDIALDTYPFTGLTTCIHGLWMGVPPITLAGSRSTSRSGLSLLAPLGLKDFVAGSAEEYLQKAEYWATQLPRLANIRSGLRQQLQQSPLMDGPAFATDFAATMRRAWQHWCSTAGQ